MANSTEAVEHGLGVTQRKDAWWLQPVAVAIGLGSFGIYSTWAALQGVNYQCTPALHCSYLSPFYSPLMPGWLGLSPAIFILWARWVSEPPVIITAKPTTALFSDPPACAVGEVNEHRYSGETKFPFLIQNGHRYFLYLAILVLCFLWYDAFLGFSFDGHFGVGVGSLVLLANATLLTCYTFGCHSLRHLIGGRLSSFHGGSCAMQHQCWKGITKLNENHMLWAWLSLVMVGFTDFYIRMVASGVFTDLRLF